MKSMSHAALLFAVAVYGCGSDPTPPPAAPTGAVEAPAAEPEPAPPLPKEEDDGSTGQLNISDEIKKACGITDAEAHFAYDSASIQSGDQPVLNKLADCFTKGPLKGRQMRLVGHADPRGEDEYNMVLGGKRADNVKDYLTRHGLPDTRAETTSRGEIDATGTDETSWAKDRRVDVVLAN